MIEQEKLSALEEAFDVLVKYNLYRRGAMEFDAAEITVAEVGEAIDLAAGTIQEYIKLLREVDRIKTVKRAYAKNMKEFQMQWSNAEKSVKVLSNLLDKERAETKRLSALLASNHIKYAKREENDEKSE